MPRHWAQFLGTVAFMFTLFLIGGAALADEDGFFGSNTAAWVQALGSIAAIAAGFVWAADSARQQRERDANAKIEATNAARANARHIAGTAVDRLGRMVRNVSRSSAGDTITLTLGDVRAMQGTMDAQRSILTAFPAHTLESQALTGTFLSFAALMSSVHGNCEVYKEHCSKHGEKESIGPFLHALKGCFQTSEHRLLQFDEMLAGRPKPYDEKFDRDDFDDPPAANGQ